MDTALSTAGWSTLSPTLAVNKTQETSHPSEKASKIQAALLSYKILESPSDLVQRKKITTVKRDVSISFSQSPIEDQRHQSRQRAQERPPAEQVGGHSRRGRGDRRSSSPKSPSKGKRKKKKSKASAGGQYQLSASQTDLQGVVSGGGRGAQSSFKKLRLR